MTGWVEPPTWFVRACIVVTVLGGVLAVLGAIRMGVTVDETFHVTRLQNFFSDGWYLLDDDIGASGLGEWVDDAFVYGPATALLLHTANVTMGNESWSTVSMTADAYVVRHVAVVLLALLGTAAAAVMTRILSGSPRWAWVTAGVLVAMPMWTGYAMFNLKDVPVATGYSLVTLACMLLLVLSRHNRGARCVVVACLASGIWLAVGTRPAIWPGLVLAEAVLFVGVAHARWRGLREWWRAADALVATFLAGGALVLTYPAVFTHPGEWMFASASQSIAYRGDAYRAYVFHEVTATMPLILLVFALVGSFVRFRERQGTGLPVTRKDLLMVLVLAQALALPGLLFFRPAAMSGGLRHVLFAAPTVAVLVTAAFAAVMLDQPTRKGRRVVAAIATVGLVVPFATQIQLFPFGYGYMNPSVDLLSGELPADHYHSSFRAYSDLVSDDAFVVCGPALDAHDRPLRQRPFGGQSHLELGENCASPDRPSVLQPYVGAGDGNGVVSSTFIALVVNNNPRPRGCIELERVTRHRLWVEVVASRALSCPLVLPAYTGPIALDGGGAGAEYLLGGWTGDGGSDHVTAERRASLGFELSQPVLDVEVRLTGEAEGDAQFMLNNAPVDAVASADGWILRLEGDVPHLGTSGNLVVTVVPRGGPVSLTNVEVISPS